METTTTKIPRLLKWWASRYGMRLVPRELTPASVQAAAKALEKHASSLCHSHWFYSPSGPRERPRIDVLREKLTLPVAKLTL